MSYMPVPIFQYFDSSRHFEVTEQGVASSVAESLQIISWTTENDLGIVFAHYIFFHIYITMLQKIFSMQQKNTRVYVDMCARACVSLSSEKPATVIIAFNDLIVKTCSQLRTTTHWVSFVTLVFVSHCVSAKYILQSQWRLWPNVPWHTQGSSLSWSYWFSILVECRTLPCTSTCSEGFFLHPEWSKALSGTGSLVWGTHALKRRRFPNELQSCGSGRGCCLVLIECLSSAEPLEYRTRKPVGKKTCISNCFFSATFFSFGDSKSQLVSLNWTCSAETENCLHQICAR